MAPVLVKLRNKRNTQGLFYFVSESVQTQLEAYDSKYNSEALWAYPIYNRIWYLDVINSNRKHWVSPYLKSPDYFIY